jgi:hypothetical protein
VNDLIGERCGQAEAYGMVLGVINRRGEVTIYGDVEGNVTKRARPKSK